MPQNLEMRPIQAMRSFHDILAKSIRRQARQQIEALWKQKTTSPLIPSLFSLDSADSTYIEQQDLV